MATLLPTRRSVVAILPLVAAASALSPLSARADAPVLNFLGVGDWGRHGGFHQRQVALQLGLAAQETNSRFVAALGDNFYENGVRSTDDPQWRTSFEDVYTAASLQTPWYPVLGNHDHRGAPQAQVDYTLRSRRWRMPSRYYKVEGATLGASHADLFFLDTTPLVERHRGWSRDDEQAANGQGATDQLAWLDAALGASRAPWKLVFGHHTIYSGGSLHGNTAELVRDLKPLLERHGVQVYINGHEHDLQHIQVGAVDYVCTGAGSEVRPTGRIAGTRFSLSRSGFAVFRLSPENLELEFRDFQGASVYRTSLARERVARAA